MSAHYLMGKRAFATGSPSEQALSVQLYPATAAAQNAIDGLLSRAESLKVLTASCSWTGNV